MKRAQLGERRGGLQVWLVWLCEHIYWQELLSTSVWLGIFQLDTVLCSREVS